MDSDCIIPVVEGDGDVKAVPCLIHAILRNLGDRSLQVGKPKNAHGSANLKRPGGIERLVKYAWTDPKCAGVLVVMDSDDDCPVTLAKALAERVRVAGCLKPTAIVAAATEYESWFLASCQTLAGFSSDEVMLLPRNLSFSGDCDSKRGAKQWIDRQFPKGRCYKETMHQVMFTRSISHELAASRSRSFRRMLAAVDSLRKAIIAGRISEITP